MDSHNAPSPTFSYRHRPRPVGVETRFTIKDRQLEVDATRRVDHIQLGAIKRVRLLYAPANIARHVFKTNITISDHGTLTIGSIAWTSTVELKRQDEAYGAFIKNLLRSVHKENPGCQFLGGFGHLKWGLLTLLTAGMLLGVGLLGWKAWSAGATSAALFIGLMGLIVIWQIEPIVRLNKPRKIDPENPPKELLP